MNANWSLTETGKVYHSFNAAGVALCRSSIAADQYREAITETKVDEMLAEAWGIRVQGYRKCERCATKEAGHRNRVETSMAPSTGEGDYLPPAEQVAVPAIESTDTETPEPRTHHYNALGGQLFIAGRGWVNHCRICKEPEGQGDHFYNKENTMGLEGRRITGPLTPRQTDIIELLAGGRRQKEAASTMGVARSYISSEMSIITAKMKAGTAAEAIALYTRAKVWREVAGRLRGGIVPVPMGVDEVHVNHVLAELADEYERAAQNALPS
jgi:DNA-binding CsgD family transcriptional regulator